MALELAAQPFAGGHLRGLQGAEQEARAWQLVVPVVDIELQALAGLETGRG